MTASHSSHLTALRDLLLATPDTGDDGFEGLVATALANLTGLTFRLAKSGSQFGRDASTPRAPFAIAMEAKRYKDKLRLETLAGKAAVALTELAGKIDAWVVGATSELGDGVESKLRDIIEREGITLLTLDWSSHPDPNLAVTLAAAKDAVLDWFAQHQPTVNQADLASHLQSVADRPTFATQRAALETAITASGSGLDALRQSSASWLRARLSDPDLSQQSFGQFITVSCPGTPALPRTGVDQTLQTAITVNPAGRRVVAVLGEEGAGKTWLVAQWWAAQPSPPIMILVAGRRARALDPTDAIGSLSRLLAEQDGRSDPEAVTSWKRRLERWAADGINDSLRFVVLFDGLNESPSLPWADLIRAFSTLARDLGGCVIATCRTAHWNRDLAPRLRGSLEIAKVPVPGYSDAELSAILATIGITVSELPRKVRDFIRNPRVCAVAVNLLNRLSLRPEELTRERLLLEYWQWRVAERSDLIAHGVTDFDKLPRSPPKNWLASQGPFDRDDWTDHSGPVKRGDGRDARADLTEIEEGRFLTISPDDDQSYEFREETLPYALGLLVNDELKVGVRKAGGDADAVLEKILDPVRGFDFVADILAAASGLAALDDGFPPAGRRALIRYWLGLQNVDDEAFQAMASYVPARPEAFLDIAELPDRLGSANQSITGLLLAKRDDPRLQAAMEARLPSWLGRWTREANRIGSAEDTAKRQAKREADINAAIAALTPAELARFRELTNEAPSRPAIPLDRLSALLMAGRPLAPFACGWVGWAFAQVVAGDFHDAGEMLAWVARLNRQDRQAFADALRSATQEVSTASTEEARRAAAMAMRLPGDGDLAADADLLSQPGSSKRWRRVETYCDTNPHDPDARPGANISNAISSLQRIGPGETWRHMGPGGDDHELEWISPALARFDPAPLIRKLRDIVETADTRTGLPLRQLGWRLPGLSALFDGTSVQALQAALERLQEDPTRLPADDRRWIYCQFVQALNPHLLAEEQLDLLLSLPDEVPLYLNLRNAALPLAGDVLETRLEAAEGLARKRILFFATASKTSLTPRVREIVQNGIEGDEETSWSAADIAYLSEDAELDDFVLAHAVESGWGLSPGDDAYGKSRAVAAAIARRKRHDLVALAPGQFIGMLAEELGGEAIERLGARLEAGLGRLIEPVDVPTPDQSEMFLGSSRDGLTATRWVDEVEDEEDGDIRSRLEELSNPEASARDFANRQEAIIAESRRYHNALSEADATELAASPPLLGLAALGRAFPERVTGLLDRVLAVTDPRLVRQIRNLALSIAAAGAYACPEKAAEVFAKMKDVRPPVNVVIDGSRTPIFDSLLFGTPDLPAFEDQKRARLLKVLDDGALESAVGAAELSGSATWLGRLAADLVATGSTPDVARGLAIAGLMDANAVSDRLLGASDRVGFLRVVEDWARKQYQRNAWAKHWYKAAMSSDDPAEFWRYSTLAAGVVDTRFWLWIESAPSGPMLTRFGETAHEALRKAAEKRHKKRSDKLYGLAAPGRDLVTALNDV